MEKALRLLEMNPVYDVSNFNDSDVFQSCIEMLPIRQSKIDLESDIVDLYDSRSIDYASKYVMEGSLNFEKFKLGGSYESNYQKIKKQQSHDRTIAIRNELSILVADVILSSSCPLNYQAKKDLIEIAKYSQNQPLSASYAAQMFIRKYGTHFTSRIQLGGMSLDTWQRNNQKISSCCSSNDRKYDLFCPIGSLPELSQLELWRVRRQLNDAVNTYVEMNVVSGCMARESLSFNWIANVADDSCLSAKTNAKFGGKFGGHSKFYYTNN
ncbi:unnamed protein product [Didymodactylos carnosus]|uniref:MACPF domain-containing protein n=1 Tax=Didymodactylos carnosus TaxID=1234261 RepID=A0A815VTH4_9BILA|nr:unnamed protein product [Didymodactylos carnosus]CAF4396288.1 unnamed protein product [Didymodactylos carnosus]